LPDPVRQPHDGPLRVGIVGCGFQGRLHAEILSGFDGVEVVALCDRDITRGDELARELEIPRCYPDYEALLAGDTYDLVTVCTMPDTHRAITLAALASGAHVLCEKPFALDSAQALDMVLAAERAGLLLSVGFNMRFMDSALAVRRFVEEGGIGRPVCCRGWMLADDVPWWGRHYDRSLSGGGALAATAVHVIDTAVWLAGFPKPLTATASAARIFPRKRARGAPSAEALAAFDVEDTIFGHVRFEGGFWMSVEGSWVWDLGGGWNYSLDLVGDAGQARLEPLQLVAERDGAVVDLTGEERGGMAFPPSVARELADVVQAIRTGGEPTVRAREALTIQCITDALYRSAELGHEVGVELPSVAAAA
jgi:predicted dehydrogenase